MDGFEFFEVLTTEKPDIASKTDVIAVSAHVHQDIIARCLKAGMSDFLPKPVEITNLHEILLRYLNGRNTKNED